MIRFSRYTILYFLLSALILVPGVYSLIRYGLKPSIDFTGGSVVEVTLEKDVTEETMRTLGTKQSLSFTEITKEGPSHYTLQMKQSPESSIDAFLKSLETSAGKVEIKRRDAVGAVVGKELLSKAVVAALFAMTAILLYVAYAFKDIKFGVSAIIALFHDVLIVFSVFSLLGHFWGVEVDTLFVTAFLTTMSFSVHDTIVIFDRIREYRRKDSSTPLDNLSDVALTETMGRSLVNSFTIIFMLLALVLMGGSTIRWFAVALLIGTITGTYSSPFIATPFLIMWDKWEKRKKK